MLRGLATKLDPAQHADLLGRFHAALEIDSAIVQSAFVWTQGPTLLDAKRDQLAALIGEAQGATRG